MFGTGSFVKLLVVALFGSVCVVAAQDVFSPFTPESACADETTRPRIFKREGEVETIIEGNTATVKTKIQIIARDPFLLVFHLTRLHFLDQADLSHLAGAHRGVKGERRGALLWKFDPLGFVDRAFLDHGGFTQDNYQLNFRSFEPCEDQTCCIYQVTAVQTGRNHRAGPFFSDTIWVETDDYTIIRFKGHFVPASRLDFPVTVDHWFEFDSRRIKVAPHLWLPDRVMSRNTGKNRDLFFPQFEAETIFGDFKRR